MKIPVALTASELHGLLVTTKQHDERCYVMFLLMTLHGLRVSEAIALRPRNFQKTGDQIFLTVQRLKGSKKTTQKLITSRDPLFDELTVVSNWLAKTEDDLLFKNDGGKPLWRTHVNKLMGRYAEWAGIPSHKRHPHVLKHTCGMTLRHSGANLEVIQTALGHENINSTAQYLRVSSDEADEARANAFTAASCGY